jgi:hypothetical protein
MIRYGKPTTVIALLIVASVGHFTVAMAAPTLDAWVGTWKLDKSRSDFTGDTMTYSKTAAGLYHFSDGGPVSYDFGIDGRSYPAAYGRTTTWTPVSDHAWDSVSMRDGAPTVKIHHEIAADGKPLAVTATGTKPDGTTINEQSVYQRISGTTGLVGEWRSTKTTAASPEVFIVTSTTPGVFRFEIPDYKESVEGRLDGTDLPLKGPSSPPGMTFGGKLDASGRFAYVMKFKGKPDMYGVQTMAPDGKSYTDVSWTAGKPNEKETAVYVKQ